MDDIDLMELLIDFINAAGNAADLFSIAERLRGARAVGWEEEHSGVHGLQVTFPDGECYNLTIEPTDEKLGPPVWPGQIKPGHA